MRERGRGMGVVYGERWEPWSGVVQGVHPGCRMVGAGCLAGRSRAMRGETLEGESVRVETWPPRTSTPAPQARGAHAHCVDGVRKGEST